MCQAYIWLKLLTAMRQTDLLKINVVTDIDEDRGLYVGHSKTGHKQLFEWNDAGQLRRAVDMALAARPIDIDPWLFCDRHGECYLDDDYFANGFQSICIRFMNRALRETALEKP
jgi:hypothetical protein